MALERRKVVVVAKVKELAIHGSNRNKHVSGNLFQRPITICIFLFFRDNSRKDRGVGDAAFKYLSECDQKLLNFVGDVRSSTIANMVRASVYHHLLEFQALGQKNRLFEQSWGPCAWNHAFFYLEVGLAF